MNFNLNKKLIDDYIKNNNLTVTKFCKLCHISPCTYRRIINNEDFRVIALFRIARVLDIKICELFNSN